MGKLRSSPALLILLIIISGWGYTVVFGHLLAQFDAVVVTANLW
jgi:hypothetical protein